MKKGRNKAARNQSRAAKERNYDQRILDLELAMERRRQRNIDFFLFCNRGLVT